jgi:UDP-glucose:(heptosyl)LPS alpha-1,3-glucosyltransferase
MSEPLEIVHIVREVHPYGGASGVAYYLDRWMSKLGVASRVVTLQSLFGMPMNDSRKAVVYRLRLFFDVILFSAASTFVVLAGRGRRGSVYIVHNDGLLSDIYIDHGLHKATVLANKRMFLRNPLHIFIYFREEARHAFKTYRSLVTFSDNTKANLLKYYPAVNKDVIVTIPNGVDLERFYPKELRDIRPEKFELIFVGHEFERKGLVLILQALARLPKRVTLTVVGGGADDIEAYRATAAKLGVLDRVSFLGRRQDVPDLLRAADVFIMPSSNEGWSLALIEAMATGTPVISTAVGSATSLIEQGRNGFIIERTAAGVVEAVEATLGRPSEFRDMCQASIQAAANYSWERIAQRYIDLARQVRDRKI